MPPPKILTGQEGAPRAAPPPAEPSPSRSVWAWVGLAFLIVGGADLVLTWFPVQFGNHEWEFGTVTAALNGLPVPILGLAAMIWAAGEGHRKWIATLSLAASVLLFLGILVGLILWAMGVPLALQSVPAQLGLGLKKALVKTAIQGVVYPVLLIYMIVRAGRLARGRP